MPELLEALGLTASGLTWLIVAAFVTGTLHGATGMAGGIVLTAILSHTLGIKHVIPMMTCAMIFSHSSRVFFFFKETDLRVVKTVLLYALPMVAIGSTIFTYLHPSVVAGVMATVLIVSFPVKYCARRYSFKTSQTMLAGASTFWGLLAGNVIGPGFFLAPFLLGTGMSRLTFVGTLAIIVLSMNIVKLSVFGLTDMIDARLLSLGVLVGLVTIPGNWLGRSMLQGMTDQSHRIIIDIMTIVVIINFIYLAW